MPLQPVSFEEALQEPEKKKPISFLEAIGPDVQYPELGPGATMQDVIDQPRIIQPGDRSVVRSVLPGTMSPENLRPALRLIGGDIAVGKTGDTHPDIIDREGIDAEDLDQRGFVDDTGKFIDREAAAQGTGLPTQREPGRLHSTDLIPGKDLFEGPRTRPQTVLPPPDVAAVDPRLDLSKAVASGFAVPEPEPESGKLIDIPQSLVDATRYSPAGPAMQFLLGQPKQTTAQEPQTPLERAEFMAALELPFGRKASIAATEVQRELYNLAQGIPQFMNTDEGALSALASLTAPGRFGVEAYFTYDMAKNVLAEAKKTYKDWGTMSGMERLRALTRVAGTTVMTALIAKAGVKTGKGLAGDLIGKPTPVTPATPEVRDTRLKSLLSQGAADLGKEWNYVPGELPGHKRQVAHTLENGNVVVSEKNLHDRLERDVAKGIRVEDAIKNIISEESNHGALVTMEGGQELAAQHWNGFTALEKAALKRIMFGAGSKVRLKDWQYGAEAIRFAMQRLEGEKPGEHIFGTRGQIFESKLLTSLLDVIGWIRQKRGTSARKEQLAHLDLLANRINELRKGAKDARSLKEAAKVYGDVRAQPGQGPGAVPVQEGGPGVQPQAEGRVAEAAQVPLEKAPPAAPTVGAQPAQAPAGLATKPPEALTSGGPAATAPIRPTADPVKEGELAAIVARTTELQRQPFSIAGVREMQKLAERQYEIEKSLGRTPGQQAGQGAGGIGEVLAMTRKQVFNREAEAEDYLNRMRMENPRSDFQMEKVGDEWQVGPTKEIPTAGADPNRVAEELGLKYAGSIMGRDQYLWIQKDEQGMSRVTVTVPQGSSAEAVKAKLQQRLNEPLAMTRKASEVTEENVDRVAVDDPSKLTHTSGIEYGITMDRTDDNVRRLELKYAEAGKSMVVSAMEKNDEAYRRNFGKMNFYGGALQGITRGEHRAAAGNYDRWLQSQDALAMSQKAEAPMDEKQVAVRIASALHNAILDPEIRKQTFNEVSDLILTQPKENWGPMLAEFEAQFAKKEISETEKQLAKVSQAVAAGAVPGVSPGARVIDPAALAEKVRDIFGGLDRQGLDARLIFELNHEPEPVAGGKKRKVTTKMGGKRGTEEVESEFREPTYEYRGRWESVLKSIRERDPSVPESLIRDRYVNRVHQFLAYAPSETIRRLIIASGAADRFLGREIVTDEAGKRVVRYTRTIPEPNLEPAVMDMAKAPSPDSPTEFQKFCLAKGITPEKGKQLLEEYRAESGRQMLELKNREEALKAKYAPKKGATKEEAEALLKQGREAMSELKKFKEEAKKGARYNRERRDNAVNFLADWLIKESEPPEVLPNRTEVDLDQIWYDHPEGHKGYVEFSPQQGGDSLFLRGYLGRGAPVSGKTASRFTHGITTVVHEGTKEVSSLSTYRHPTSGQVMIYDPRRPPGAEGKALPGEKYLRLNKLLGLGYRVKSYMLVFDPVTDFHQKWVAEGERTAEQVFDSKLGTDAELRGRGKMAALTSLINQGIRPEGSEFDDVGEVTPESMYALNAWLHSKGGQTWGFFGTDPQALIRGPITSVEADALYRAFKDNKVKSVDDWERVFNRMRVDRKIAESKPLAEMFRLSPWEYCFTSAIEKIARKRYRELVTGTGHYGPDPKTGFPDPEATRFREVIKKYPPLPNGFAEQYVKLKGAEADKMFNTLTEEQKTRYRLVEYYRQNELLNALQYAYDTAKEIQAQHVGAAGAELVEGPITAAKDTLAFRQRAIADYGDTARREVEQDAVRKTVSRQYAGRPVPRELGPAPEPGTPISARGLTRQIPTYEEMGATGIPKRGAQQRDVLARAETQFPPSGPRPYSYIMPEKGGPIGKPAYGGKVRPGVPPPSTLEGMVSREREKGYVPSEHATSEAAYQQELARKYRLNDPVRREPFPTPETIAMTRKHGVANVYQREMVEQGRATIHFADPDEGPLAHKHDLIEAGREAVINGEIQPRRSMIVAKESAAKTGAPWLTWKDVAAMRYHDYQLQQLADALLEQKSPQAEEARKLSDAWHKDYNEMAKAGTAHQMHVLQGYSVIGPGDMQSITFVKRMYREARGIAEGYGPDEEYDLTPQEIEWVNTKVEQIKSEAKGVEEAAKGLDAASQKGVEPALDQGNKMAIEKVTQKIVDIKKRALDNLFKRGPSGIGDVLAMAKKSDELPKLSNEDAVNLVDLGMTVMAELSAEGKMSDSMWRKTMVDLLKEKRPDLEVHLDHIRALAEKTRMDFVNNEVGTGDPYKDAREHFTRKQPTIEESKAAIGRALAVDPTGQKISPMEAYHVWNYLRLRFFNAAKPEWDIRTIREKAGKELGVGATRLFRAMSSNRSMREPTDALLKKMRDEQRVRSQATNWLKNLEYPFWFRTLRAFPRIFFFDKILGHGLVPLITHASNMMFNPWAWKNYFKAWPEMYRMSFGTKPISRLLAKVGGPEWKGITGQDYHSLRMQELMGAERFEWWKRRGLEHDPFKFSDDYLIEWVYNLFEEKGVGGKALAKIGIPGREFLQAMIGGRSFDVLKQLRYAQAETMLHSMPEHLRTPEMGDLIADSVNHATGITKKSFGEAGAWLMFAPKLEASRWAWLFRDTIKAADYWRKSDATVEQKAWARAELKQKGAVLGLYWVALGMNYGFLKMIGSDQEINATDPTKSDFMQFKVAGLKVGVLSPIIGIFKLFATLMHDMAGERTKFERLTTRQRAVGEHLFEYARGKASPIASFGLEAATAQSTYPTRPLGFLPWSEKMTRRQRLAGLEPYGLAEYGFQTFAPIPLEEVLREVWGEMGVDKETMHKWIRALIVGGAMAGTGARLSQDIDVE